MQWNTDTDEGRIPVLWWLGGSSDTESQSKQFEAGIANACNTVVREADKKKIKLGCGIRRNVGVSEKQAWILCTDTKQQKQFTCFQVYPLQ